MSDQAGKDQAGNRGIQVQPTVGIRFAKGVSGNPSGRPSHAALRAALKEYERETIDRWIEHMRGDNAAVSMDAITKIIAYLYGKPDSVQLDDLSDAEILAFVMWRQEKQAMLKAANRTEERAQ